MAAAASETTLHFAGAKDFRMRVVLACLARRPIVIERVRASDESPGVTGKGDACRPIPERAKRPRDRTLAFVAIILAPLCSFGLKCLQTMKPV